MSQFDSSSLSLAVMVIANLKVFLAIANQYYQTMKV